MNTKLIEYIITISEEKNILRAAEKLYISQSTLSQALINLETELGTPLFIRSKNGLIITEAGEEYVSAAKCILQIKENTYRKIKTIVSKNIEKYRVGISSNNGLKRFLLASSEYKLKNPRVIFYATEDNPKNLLENLKKGIYALIIITVDNTNSVPFPYTVISKEEILLLAPLHMKNSFSERQVHPRDLNHVDIVISKPGSTMRSITDKLFAENNITPNVIYELNSSEMTIQMVQEGKCCAFLPDSLLKDVNNVSCYSLFPKIYRYQIAVFPEHMENNDIILEFVEMIQNYNP